jgi:hypothetical protein
MTAERIDETCGQDRSSIKREVKTKPRAEDCGLITADSLIMNFMTRITQSSWRRILLPVAVLALVLIAAATAGQPAARGQKTPEGLSAAEFARLINELSEEGGYFRSDNFTSNEDSYLHVVDKLRQLGATGGAYIGVGPEQNFTYIAKVRPRIAFIVDIRRQAVIQHLMYKAIFQLAPDRIHFLSLWLSRPLPKDKAPTEKTPLNEMLTFFGNTPASEQAYTANLAAIRKAIREDFQFPLSESDLAKLEYVYKSFRDQGLEIGFQMGGPNRGFMGGFPNLKELIAQTDLNGKVGNFLTRADDYDFVRGLHRKNLIIPVVGDFAGKKALAAVGEYLRKNGYTVTAFYTSNVEMILFNGGLFAAFVENVSKLPINDRSLFIRAAFDRYAHPAQVPGHRLITLLQPMTVFLKDIDEGRYQNYRDLITTHYIAGEKP